MTIKKCIEVVMYGVYMFFDALDKCVISINGTVDISLLELTTGFAIASIIVVIISNFSWGS